MIKTVLTPNQRLAATLIKRYQKEQIEQGNTCWPTQDILPITSWVQRSYQAYAAHEMEDVLLLSLNQELALWENIISAAPESESLLKLSDLAKEARSAWNNLKQWQVDFNHPAFSLTENSSFFQRFAKQFAQCCEQNHWLDSASLADHLRNQIEQKNRDLPHEITLINFTEITPQYEALFNTLQKQGVQIHHQTLESPLSSSIHRVAALDDQHEIELVARWAKKILEVKPDARMGYIASQLEEKRDAFIQIFSDMFGSHEKFNISAGKTLTAYPVTRAALQWLNLSTREISFEELSFLLHSPFLAGSESEMMQRLQWDAQLRRQNLNAASLKAISKDCPCPKLATVLDTFIQKREAEASLQPISQWMLHCSQLLESLGWPGEQSLNSAEYQVVNEWNNLLKETATLEQVLPSITYNQALHYLSTIAAKTYFQPESPEAPIQILGQLEGAGLPFDYLWVMGLDDTAWPPAPSPNPFIPHELQKKLQMPNSCAERQLNYSLKLTEQFKKAAPVVIFSHTAHRGEEVLLPSPLIAAFELIEPDLAPLFSSTKALFDSRNLETLVDNQAPALKAGEKVRGGASIFEMQAACSFKAFAKLRLNAKSLDESQPGLPANTKGNVIHRVLELFWKDIGDHARLIRLSENEIQTLLDQHLKAALEEIASFIAKDSFFYKLVSERLRLLLLQWLDLEKSRPPFKVIAVEEEKTINIADLPIKIRIDRMDEVEDGRKLIIDYKTKKQCDTKNWFGERPTEPQLPLYCIIEPENSAGIAFGQLHMTQTSLHGISQTELGIAGIQPMSEKSKADANTWEEQLQQWQLNLTQLIHDFQAGIAEVNPRDYQTCAFCDLQSLCRIYEKMTEEE